MTVTHSHLRLSQPLAVKVDSRNNWKLKPERSIQLEQISTWGKPVCSNYNNIFKEKMFEILLLNVKIFIFIKIPFNRNTHSSSISLSNPSLYRLFHFCVRKRDRLFLPLLIMLSLTRQVNIPTVTNFTVQIHVKNLFFIFFWQFLPLCGIPWLLPQKKDVVWVISLLYVEKNTQTSLSESNNGIFQSLIF